MIDTEREAGYEYPHDHPHLQEHIEAGHLDHVYEHVPHKDVHQGFGVRSRPSMLTPTRRTRAKSAGLPPTDDARNAGGNAGIRRSRAGW